MLRWLCLSFLIIFYSVRVSAIQAVVSHTIFYLQDTSKGNIVKPYIEAVWQIDPTTLRYHRGNDSLISGKVKTDITFYNTSGTTITEEHFILSTTPLTTVQQLAAQNIMDLHRYVLPYGTITMKLHLTDITDTTNQFSYTDSFTVTQPTSKAFYSGIQLLDTAYASTATSIFQKNYQQQIPLCSNFYDENRNLLHYYVELYNTTDIPKDAYPIVQHIFISRKENDDPIPSLASTDTMESASIQPVTGTFPIDALGSGNYYINVSLVSAQHKLLTSTTKFFQRFNTHPTKTAADTATQPVKTIAEMEDVTLLDLNKTFIVKYTLPQVRAILKMLIPVSDDNGIQTIHGFLKKPDETYMRYYIYNFFANRNRKDPEKAWQAYADTVRVVNKLFGSRLTPGYETDRGLIYLKYGKPTEQITVESEAGSLPYEIWQYNTINIPSMHRKKSNGVFLFYRPADMISGFELLSSNIPGEVQNAAWRSYLYTNGTTTNGNSRAEQYMTNR